MAQAVDSSKAQQRFALGMSTFSFTLCFAMWTIFSILGVKIAEEFQLSSTELGLLMATPILTGSVSRLFLGIASDYFGGRTVFAVVMLLSSGSAWLLSLSHSYYLLLLCALGIGLAGGSFVVGVAYVSAWFKKNQQGTALGIFGAGNVGSSVTSLCMPMLLLIMDWRSAVQIYAIILATAGVGFYFLAKNEQRERPREQVSIYSQLHPLKEVRVWRFSLYYFFVFGAFVALALWLPQYTIGVFDVSLAQAGLIAGLYTVPGSLFRILGGILSDRYGARKVMYWTFIASVVCTFILSYPNTHYSVEGIRGVINFSLETNVYQFAVICIVLGFFMSLGKAAVFKHIPVYYPNNVGVVSGAVGMVGGLGGFFLPLTFGMLNDLVGVWQTCFMLLFVLCSLALTWMHFAIRKSESKEWRSGRTENDLPELTE